MLSVIIRPWLLDRWCIMRFVPTSQVSPLDDIVETADIFVTTTGNKDIIMASDMAKMKNNAIVGNIGHFDNEIDMAGLLGWPGIKRQNIKPQVTRRKFPHVLGRSYVAFKGLVFRQPNSEHSIAEMCCSLLSRCHLHARLMPSGMSCLGCCRALNTPPQYGQRGRCTLAMSSTALPDPERPAARPIAGGPLHLPRRTRRDRAGGGAVAEPGLRHRPPVVRHVLLLHQPGVCISKSEDPTPTGGRPPCSMCQAPADLDLVVGGRQYPSLLRTSSRQHTLRECGRYVRATLWPTPHVAFPWEQMIALTHMQLNAWMEPDTSVSPACPVLQHPPILPQVIAQLELWNERKSGRYEKKVYVLPKHLDEKVRPMAAVTAAHPHH